MKNLLFALLIASSSSVFAQEKTREKPENQIFNLLNKELTLTPEQTPKVQSAIGDFGKQFAAAGKQTALGAAKQAAQQVVFSKFSDSLGKLITPAQLTKFNAIKGTVQTLFSSFK
jgi:hypothetical protein